MRKLLFDAELLYRQQRFGDSLDLIRQALLRDPENPGLLTFMGLCQLKLKRLAEAEDSFKKSLLRNPNGDFAHYLYANLELEKGRIKQAEQSIQNAIDINPICAEYYGILALCRYHRHKSLKEISHIAKKGLNFDSANVMCQNVLSMVELRRGNKRLAEDILSFQLEKAPDNSLSLTNQGWISLHSGQYEKAGRLFDSALRRDPKNDWARSGKIQVLKTKLPLYRYILKYILVLSRLSPLKRIMLAMGVYLSLVFFMNINSFSGVAAISLVFFYALFVYIAWLGDSLINLAVSVSRSGKSLINPIEKRNSFVLSACLLGSGIAGCCYLIFGQEKWLMGAVGLFLFCIPLHIGLQEHSSLRRTAARIFLGAMALVVSLWLTVPIWLQEQQAVLIQSGLIYTYIFLVLLFVLMLTFIRH